MPSVSRRHLSAAGLAAVVAVTLSACGSSSDPPSTNSAAAADAARLRFAQCMRQHGVDIPDNPGEGRQTFRTGPRATFQAALKACDKYRRQAFGNITPQQRQEFRDAFVKFAACMRQHGVDVPDPSSGPPANGQRRRLPDRNDPTVQAAMKACQSQLPKRPGGGRGGVFFGPGGGG